jgi:hypothetical protein
VFLKCGACRARGFFTDLRNKTAGIATLFQGYSDEKAVRKAPILFRRAFKSTLLDAFAGKNHRLQTTVAQSNSS